MDVPSDEQIESLHVTADSIEYKTTNGETLELITANDETHKERSNPSSPASVKTTSISRELKSILALSKEANLDTNIAHKRESRKIELMVNKKQPSSRSPSGSSGSEQSVTKPQAVATANADSPTDRIKSERTDLESSNDEYDDEGVQKRNVVHNATTSGSYKKPKRKRISLLDSPAGGSSDGEEERKVKKSLPDNTMETEISTPFDKDKFCWRCHRDGPVISCKTCPRSYHQKCLKQFVPNPEHWPCPECVAILKAESTKTRSNAMKHMTLEHLCNLLKFAVKRMIQYAGSEPFNHPVNREQFPDYNEYIIHPMDLTRLQDNIRENLYGSTEAFIADAKWILHNSIIFNSYQSKLTTAAKGIFKICKQEMLEIETCAECYLNANTKKTTWFIEVCSKPHILLWAKLKGFPYWPAKAMSTNSLGSVDVRFFGAHDRAWVPIKECFLYSKRDPNSNKQKRNDIAACIKELEMHIDNINAKYGSFNYAPYRMLYEPENENKQLKIFIPNYFKLKSNQSTPPDSPTLTSANKSDAEESTPSKKLKLNTDTNTSSSSSSSILSTPKITAQEFDKFVEGYGTSTDDLEAIIDREIQKRMEGKDETDCYSDIDESSIGFGKKDDICKDSDDFETQIDPNINVCTKRSRIGIASKLKLSLERQSNDSGRKRSSVDNISISPLKISRSNSDQSDCSRLSNISDKINKLDVPEDAELSLGNDKPGRISASDISADSYTNSDTKRKPVVQVNINNCENTEITISDWLMMKMSQADTRKDRKNEADALPTDEPNSSETETSENDFPGPSTSQCSDSQQEVDSSSKEDSVKSTDTVKVVTLKTYGRRNSRPESKNFTKSDSDDESIINVKSINDLIIGEITTPSNEIAAEDLEDKNSHMTENSSSTDDKNTSDVESTLYDKTGEVPEPPIANEVEKLQKNNKQITILSESNTKLKPLKKIALFQDFDNDNSSSDVISNESESIINKEDAISVEYQGTVREGPKLPNSTSITLVKKKNSFQNKIEPTTEKTTTSDNTSPSGVTKFKTNKLKPQSSSTSIIELNSEVDLVKKPTVRETVKIIDVNGILNISDNAETSNTTAADKEIDEPIQIKSESESEPEETGLSEDIEAKRKYLFALNISSRSDVEKSRATKLNKGLSTRSRTKEDNVSRIIDNIASNYSREHEGEEIPMKQRAAAQALKEITIKSLASMQPPQKQKARKSFPAVSPYSRPPTARKQTVNVASERNEQQQPNSVGINKSASVLATGSIMSSATVTDSLNSIQPPPLARIGGNYNSLPPNKQIQYSQEMGNQVLTMVQHPITNGNFTNPSMFLQNSQQVPVAIASHCNIINPQTTNAGNNLSDSALNQQAINEDLSLLRSIVPENLSKAVSELICRPPPRLKPKPPSVLSSQFDEGRPSTAGPVSQQINAVAHRIADYFRGLLTETVTEFGAITENPEAQITSLRLENEHLKHKHAEEILEIKKNVSSLLRDIQKSIGAERTKLVEETRSLCEAETIKRVDEAKTKQWCANCLKEAQFYCCWNTSYCDYPCQQKHWSKHMKTCSQHISNISSSLASCSGPKTPASIVLRPTNSPKALQNKNFGGKGAKLILNRPNTNNKAALSVMNVGKQSGSSGQHTITLLESTPGNFEILGNHGPISVGGKLIASSSILGKLKANNVISVTTASNTNQGGRMNSLSSKSLLITPTLTSSADKTQSIVIDDNDK